MAKNPPRKPPKSSKKTRRKTPPVFKAFLLAEKIIRDEYFGSLSLVGLFTEFSVPKFPTFVGPFWILLQLSDGVIGEYAVRFEVQDLEQHRVLGHVEGPKAIFSYRPEKYDVILMMPPIWIVGPGKVYAIVAYADGHPVADQKFTIQVRGSDSDEAKPDA